MKKRFFALVLTAMLLVTSCGANNEPIDPVQIYIDNYVTDGWDIPEHLYHIVGSLMMEVTSDISGDFQYSIEYGSMGPVESINIRIVQEDKGVDRTWVLMTKEN